MFLKLFTLVLEGNHIFLHKQFEHMTDKFVILSDRYQYWEFICNWMQAHYT